MYSWVQTKNVPPSYFNMYILHQYQGWEGFISFPSLVWKVLGRWECCKEVTLTLGGLTSTSSRIERGSKLRRLIFIHLDFIESWFSYIQTHRLHWSLRHRVRVLHALEAPSSSSVAGPHNPTSTSSLYFHICFCVNFICHSLGVACYLTLPCDCQPHLRPPHPTGLEQGTQIWIHWQ